MYGCVHCCHGHIIIITVLYVLRMRHYVLHHFLEHSIFPRVRFITCVRVSSYSCWICRLIVGSGGQVITVGGSGDAIFRRRPAARPT